MPASSLRTVDHHPPEQPMPSLHASARPSPASPQKIPVRKLHSDVAPATEFAQHVAGLVEGVLSCSGALEKALLPDRRQQRRVRDQQLELMFRVDHCARRILKRIWRSCVPAKRTVFRVEP